MSHVSIPWQRTLMVGLMHPSSVLKLTRKRKSTKWMGIEGQSCHWPVADSPPASVAVNANSMVNSMPTRALPRRCLRWPPIVHCIQPSSQPTPLDDARVVCAVIRPGRSFFVSQIKKSIMSASILTCGTSKERRDQRGVESEREQERAHREKTEM